MLAVIQINEQEGDMGHSSLWHKNRFIIAKVFGVFMYIVCDAVNVSHFTVQHLLAGGCSMGCEDSGTDTLVYVEV